jgi:hypothetical protein
MTNEQLERFRKRIRLRDLLPARRTRIVRFAGLVGTVHFCAAITLGSSPIVAAYTALIVGAGGACVGYGIEKLREWMGK